MLVYAPWRDPELLKELPGRPETLGPGTFSLNRP